MKIRIANNMGDISGEMLINPEEIGGNIGIERAASLSKEGITIAIDIFKIHPEIKQVTLDTMSDEERQLIEVATQKGGSS